ncbi:flagellar M-ring protein [mine drainage metagenome]|uniref:Flagellar M-ring protein n=1 Tax=mine drainage metagenome TaxID=410659 RepID=A0A1J5RZ02_9ZZZZ
MASAEQATTIPLSLQAFNRLSMSQKLGAMVVVALSVALLAGTWLWSRSIDYSVLFSNVSDRDGGDIIASLQQMNVPYKFSEHGSAILVPATQVHETRLKLASQGLPKGGLVGFEVLDNQKLGASQFLEQVNYQRALEGELARTVQSLAAVRGARVHLAIPKQSAFVSDEQKPTASVLVYLQPGRTLDPSQISGIVHLVSSAVPQLAPENVSVIDGNGNLISQSRDPLRDAGLDPSQLKYEHEVEAGYAKRIETILEPFVGTGNVRAQVTADLDFSQTEQMAESYQPNPAPNTAIRSEQTSETGRVSPGATGVPGALSNQPPVPATAPLTTPPATGTGQPGGQAGNFNKNATINYELDKTIKHTKGVPGSIKRLSVAVVVNYKNSPPDRNGKIKSTPLSAAEMKQINDLVHEAMGYSKERGDTVNVVNTSFTPSTAEKEAIPQIPLWKDPEILAMAQEGIKYLLLGIVALLLWSRVVKPLLGNLLQPPVALEAAGPAALVATEDRETQIQHMAYDAKLASVRDLAKTDPKAVANVIKEWSGASNE